MAVVPAGCRADGVGSEQVETTHEQHGYDERDEEAQRFPNEQEQLVAELSERQQRTRGVISGPGLSSCACPVPGAVGELQVNLLQEGRANVNDGSSLPWLVA